MDINKRDMVSAGEIRRYLYCNYQWYYERKYGAAELARRNRQYMERAGITPAAESPLQKGLLFHVRFGRGRGLRLAYGLLRAAVILGLFLYFLLRGGFVVI